MLIKINKSINKTIYQEDRKHLEEETLKYNHGTDCSANDVYILPS